MDERLFDTLADAELRALEDALGDVDPDECEVDNAAGVLTLSLADGSRLVINSHRAARQIWMAAHLPGARNAWHFSPQKEGESWRWRTEADELRAALASLLRGRLSQEVSL
jgi:CyaY protein